MSLKAQRMTDMALTVRDVDRVVMTPAERRAIRDAYADLVKYWNGVKQERYDAAVANRNKLSRQITKGKLVQKVSDIRAAVKAGAITADEGRAEFRDLFAQHQRLLGVVKALAQMDDELEQFDATSAAEVQADMIDRYPALKTNAPTLEDLAERKLAERARKSWALPGDIDYDAPSAEDVGIQPPNSRPQ